MRLSEKSSGSKTRFYIIRDVRRNGRRSTEIVEKLGSAEEIMEKYHVTDARTWANEYLRERNRSVSDSDHKILIPFHTDVLIPMNQQNTFNIGYLFLQQLYYKLRLPYICRKISERHAFQYDMDSILSRLLYGRILHPSSKLSCYEQSAHLYEQPNFELHHIYRALSVLSEESDFIQAELYKSSKKVIKRSTGVLYYDCTNYFFETEAEEEDKRYGASKEHRPSPIVQMGLFMDRSGLPLAFNITPGNRNEQLTMTPLEMQIMRDFNLSKFVVCTDAGLSSDSNRKFNNFGERSFITTQSVRKMKRDLKDWALSTEEWSLVGSNETFSIKDLEDTPLHRSQTFYKQKLIEGYDEERDIPFDQTLIVTFSLKYKLYQQQIRERQIERAWNLLKDPSRVDKSGSNDVKRFIKKNKVTKDGEVAETRAYELDQDVIDEEAKYDGFYAVCTNLDDDPDEIIRINQGRWEIEESFRIMKSEFEARPVFLKRRDRIQAHFLTCFLSLLLYRLLECQLNGGTATELQDEKTNKTRRNFTCDTIIDTLREMNMTRVGEEGYIPAYTRNRVTEAIHKNAGFRTDYELSTEKSMRGYCRRSKGL